MENGRTIQKKKLVLLTPVTGMLGTIPSSKRKTLTKPYNPQKKQWRAGEKLLLGRGQK